MEKNSDCGLCVAETVLVENLSWLQTLWAVEGCEVPENKTSLRSPSRSRGPLKRSLHPPTQLPLDALSKQPVRASYK